jgi:DNA-binding HxlR family transcriptional regulator
MKSYGQYCPIAIGSELVGDRWITLILRELILGSSRFNEIARGLPGISRTLLSDRLRQLERSGLIRREGAGNGAPAYRLTPAGEDLEPVIWSLGEWAVRWRYFADPEDHQLDDAHLMWCMQNRVCFERVPPGKVVIQFEVTGHRGRMNHYWLILEHGEATACLKDPGFEPSLVMATSSRELHRIWLGRTTLAESLASGATVLSGPLELRRAFPQWFAWSQFYPVLRRYADGRGISAPGAR